MRADDQDKSAEPPPLPPGADKSFLGPEFVTWLFFHLEGEGWMLDLPEAMGAGRKEGSTVAFAVGEKAQLRTLDKTGARVTLAGPDLDDSGELLQAVRRGAFLETLELQVAISERVYTFTLRAADGGISSVKLPELPPMDSEEDPGADPTERKTRRPRVDDLLTLRMACLEEVERIVDALFARFVTRRLARAWHTEDISAMRKKVASGLAARLGANR